MQGVKVTEAQQTGKETNCLNDKGIVTKISQNNFVTTVLNFDSPTLAA